jgi:hypothetical protein
MKAKKALLLLAALLLIGGGTLIYLFGGPYQLVNRPLDAQSLQHLRSSSGGASWASSPSETAYEYLYWWPEIDRPNRAKLEITTSYRSPDEAVVTFVDHDCKSDSTSLTCDRLTLRRENGAWVPVRNQAAWQGRGRIGWTTQPTL